MSQSDSFNCPHCGAVYKRGQIPAGKRVRCKQCESPFVIPEPETESAQAAESAPEEAPRSPARAGARAAAGVRASGGRRTAAASEDKKSNTGILIGAAAGVIAIVLALVFSGVFSGAEPEKPDVVEQPKEKTPAEKYAEALEAASQAGNQQEQVRHYRQAIELLEKHEIADARFNVNELHERIIQADPDDTTSRSALGFTKYTGGFEKYEGQWIKFEDQPRIETEFSTWKEEQAKKKAEEKWSKDALAIKARKIRDYFIDYAKKVPDFDFVFFFDTQDVPRPFMFIVQDVPSPSPEASVRITAPGIVALREAFHEGYPKGTIPHWSDTEEIVPIVMFKDGNGYEHYCKHAKEHAGPPKDFAAAFYRHSPYEDAPTGTFRGIMFVWPGDNDKEFYSSLFHEATHQIVHNASVDGSMGRTPWIQEGIAEWWSAYEGSRNSGYKFGLFQHGRFRTVENTATMYYQKRKDGEGYFTPKRLLNISNEEFRVWGSRRQPADLYNYSLIYAQGWAFLYFCYYFEDDDYEGDDESEKYPYREAFHKFMHDELRHELKPTNAARYLGIEKEEDWDDLNERFFFFCKRTMRGMR